MVNLMVAHTNGSVCFVAWVLAAACHAAALPVDQIVPDYMEGDLETAIVPTPQEARLSSTAFVSSTWSISIQVQRSLDPLG